MTGVEASGLTKVFGETKALDGVGFTVPEGTILGLLGPNGAGKTTSVRVLTTLLIPDSGTAFVDGVDVLKHPAQVRARIGLTGQYAAVEERLTARENLQLIGRYFHINKATAKARSTELLERFDLVEASDRVVSGFSGGMRRRLDIAMSLFNRPSVLFLDEPTTGLDPRSRLGMWDLISELRDDGTTTLLTTQYLEEADALADDIVVIDHGKVIAHGTSDELKDQSGGDRLRVTIAKAENVEIATATLQSIATGRIDVSEGGRTINAPIRAGGGVVPGAIRSLDAAGVDVIDIEVRRPTLDDVFLELTGHSTQEADGDTTDEGTA